MPPKRNVNREECECITSDSLQSQLDAALQPLRNQLTQIQNSVDVLQAVVGRVTKLENTVSSLEDSLTNCSDELITLKSKTLPDLSDHFAKCEEGLADYVLSLDAHSRKFNVIFHGVKGEPKEEESVTRRKTQEFAQKYLGLTPELANGTTMSACHRLSNRKDSGVIVRFGDLSQRDLWLAGTRKLKDTARGHKISVSTDLPPVIRPLKDELMLVRSKMEPALKQKTKLKYLTQFPYVELRAEGRTPIRPTKTLREVTKELLKNLDPAFQFPAG